uniref:Double zinc ribbon and ankyrin repeat domains 1 n=1 Tax=Amphiprion percula TaxID=161767 RepID=A0A3P8TCY1_AMPPE
MAAGAVSAPLIIPMIQPQTSRVKNHIDTSTPVCLQSDTPGVHIFYTLDGSRPVAASRRYGEPVLLPAGRVSVRALAETSDGRQSSVVTKVFFVDQADTRMDPEVLQDTQQVSKHLEHLGTPGTPGNTCSCMLQMFLQTVTCFCSSLRLKERPVSSVCLSRCLQSVHLSRYLQSVCPSRCLQCLVLHPLDPLAWFCPRCGAVFPPFPVQRLPLAEGGQTLLFVFCNSLVPVSTAPIDEQPLEVDTQHTHLRHGHVLCVCCGSGNPAHLSSCLTCETHLQQVTPCVVCWRCGANGHLNAFYCGSCGVFLEMPSSVCLQATPSSDPTASVKVAPPTVDRSTQTVGLYYPSATELHRKEQQRAEKLSRDRRPPLTAVSPGQGYWRKQLDHVCAHLRSYAQNHAPFRALLGEPRLGQVVSAVVQEDRYEVSLTVSFMSAGREIKQVSEGHSAAEGAGYGWRSGQRHAAAPGSGTAFPSNQQPPVGHVFTVTGLFALKGVDPYCCGGDSRHALAVTMVNGHHDVLPVLVQRGADVEQESGRCNAGVRRRNATGQTALDVALSSSCSRTVSLLAAQT